MGGNEGGDEINSCFRPDGHFCSLICRSSKLRREGWINRGAIGGTVTFIIDAVCLLPILSWPFALYTGYEVLRSPSSYY